MTEFYSSFGVLRWEEALHMYVGRKHLEILESDAIFLQTKRVELSASIYSLQVL